MKNNLLLSFLICLSLHCPAQQQPNTDSLVRTRVELGETPGMVVGILANNKIAYYAHGLANVATGEPVTSKTLFEIGSITKTFTALMLELMVQKRILALSDPVIKFLPNDALVPNKDGKQITLGNLVTHRSGLPRMPDNLNPGDPQNPWIDYSYELLKEFLSEYQLPREPGSQYEYSNLGVGLLGYALTQASHQTWQQLLRTMITQPLRMDHTFLNTGDPSWQHVAIGYNDKSILHPWTWTDESVLQGAGGIISDAEVC